MKKRNLLIWAVLLALILAMPCFGAEPKLSLSDTQGQTGKIVYLTVTLDQPVSANTLGVTYSYDAGDLKPLPDSCSWSKKGTLQDFDTKDKGVWTSGTAVEHQGEICTLAFRVAEDADFSSTVVRCTLIAKNGSDSVGEYKAQAKITLACQHEYGKWSSSGEQFHSRSCRKCDAVVTQSHNWGKGTVKDDPKNPGMQVTEFQCGTCGGKKTVEATIDDAPLFPTVNQPETQSPTLPTIPEATLPENPINPTSPSIPGQSIVVHPTTNDEHDHDHSHGSGEYDTGEPRTDSTIIFVLVFAMLISGAILIVRKKH